jgi:hypothetical protein
MTQAAQELKDRLVDLPSSVRAEIALFLIGSLDTDVDDDVEAAWDVELTQRDADIRSGIAGEDAVEVMARVRARLA